MQESLEEDVYAGWKRAFDDAVTYYTTPTNYSAASDGWFVVGNFSMEGTHGVTHYLPSSPDAPALVSRCGGLRALPYVGVVQCRRHSGYGLVEEVGKFPKTTIPIKRTPPPFACGGGALHKN